MGLAAPCLLRPCDRHAFQQSPQTDPRRNGEDMERMAECAGVRKKSVQRCASGDAPSQSDTTGEKKLIPRRAVAPSAT